MLSLQALPACLLFHSTSSRNLRRLRNPIFPRRSFPGRTRLSCAGQSSRGRNGFHSVRCLSKTNSKTEDGIERPPFDINLAVVLAGFAFEAYTSPPENVGRREVDAADCQTVYLSESFVREIYDGQLFIKLKKGSDLPIMDPWGTSDPYVVMQLDGQVVKSKVKWGTKEPTWNEEFTFNVKQSLTKNLQVAAWDANLVTPHKRMGNGGFNLEGFSDGKLHEVLVELEGMGGGGKIQLEVQYKFFEQIEEEKKQWTVPFLSDFLRKNGFESALETVVGSEKVQARQFVEYAFGQLRSFNDVNLWKDLLSSGDNTEGIQRSNTSVVMSETSSEIESRPKASLKDTISSEESKLEELGTTNASIDQPRSSEPLEQVDGTVYWKNFTDIVNQNVFKTLGLPVPEKLKWDGFDLLNKIGLQSRKIAEAGYVESGLATPGSQDVDISPPAISAIQSSLPDIKKATKDLQKQTDSVLGAIMVLTAAVSQIDKEAHVEGDNETTGEASPKIETNVADSKSGELVSSEDQSALEEKKAEEMKALFSTAETAMEAWAMLATSLGQSSFIQSEFEKICFLDNATTDTQVAIWRDSVRRRLVVAFRGTEQVRWKDLRTDLMLAPSGLNPERISGDFKQEVQVHSGFLSAFDSVRIRITSLIKLAICYTDDNAEPPPRWHVYVTGHSLGGALATLLALEISSSQLAKRGAISLTMYNFGSPRVGNKRFAEVYNEKVKDSWRVVNHRDIIPTVPRLMGYCHVAQPIYLAAGDIKNALVNIELLEDGYQGDVIGESTPDALVNEFMKGEKELIDKILQTEINIFCSIRDGTALMQHMEDFYYVSLLEKVRSNYDTLAKSQSNVQDSSSTA